ncbi:HNH endonuclease [Halocatena pleomorpha]|uniref:HNH endonuclease n=1 Tax=Halocatena pleomorpha TaxID=1785090 RepID=A0A3P3REY1_9EURY|nr:HNH endonuclease [Halocatena pleomorpha]RRJ31528.1 HNH endonuclease [Halocatena pleomorpha]
MSSTTREINPTYDEQDGYDQSDDRYPPDWDARKKAVQKRDDWTCKDCGVKSGPHAGDDGKQLHVHHITHLSDGGSNQLSNLTTLCVDCHNDRHEHDITEGLDDYHPEPGLWERFRQLVRSIVSGVVCLPIHAGVVSLLLTQPSHSPLWLVSLGAFVVLAAVLAIRPGTVAATYTATAATGTVIHYGSSIDQLGGEDASTLLLSAWLPALLAVGWWYYR